MIATTRLGIDQFSSHVVEARYRCCTPGAINLRKGCPVLENSLPQRSLLSVDLPDPTTVSWIDVESPIGRLRLVGSCDVVTALHFEAEAEAATSELAQGPRRATLALAQQLDDYFVGKRQEFAVTLAAAGTDFQLKVWNRLLAIPYGQVASYAEVAVDVGHPRAHRAVGSTNRRNPLPIVIPCHRVIATGGALAGYGGGLTRKRFLLGLERAARAA